MKVHCVHVQGLPPAADSTGEITPPKKKSSKKDKEKDDADTPTKKEKEKEKEKKKKLKQTVAKPKRILDIYKLRANS